MIFKKIVVLLLMCCIQEALLLNETKIEQTTVKESLVVKNNTIKVNGTVNIVKVIPSAADILNKTVLPTEIRKIPQKNVTLGVKADLHEDIKINTTEINKSSPVNGTTGVRVNLSNDTIINSVSNVTYVKNVTEIFNRTNRSQEVNATHVVNCQNVTLTNCSSIEEKLNGTGNYSVIAEAIGGSAESPNLFTPKESVAIAAAICLVTAIIGYLSCVGYRRSLEKKYGNKQILISEEVYDTTDLRYFEI